MTKKRFTLQESDIYNRNDVIHDKGIEMPQSTVCDLLNEQEERIKRLKTIREEQTETILKQKRKINELEQELKRCREWINSDKNDYELTLAFIKNKGFSLQDVLDYEKTLKKKGCDVDD